MNKNYQKIALLGVLFFISANANAQTKDSIKTNQVDEVKITIGSRNKARVATDTPVPVDVIIIGSQAVLSPQMDLNQILNYAAPSFTSNSTTVADGTDHVDPAQLRGLGLIRCWFFSMEKEDITLLWLISMVRREEVR
jgi:iron complex outermembrane receptor protein